MPKKNRIESFKKFILRKRILIPLGLIVLFMVLAIIRGKTDTTITLVTPVKGDLSSTVRATGQVTSKTDLNLSFTKGGVVKHINVSVGDKVNKGQVLAMLDGGAEGAAVSQARGALAGAKARLAKIVEGASTEEIALSKVALANAETDLENIKATQNHLVKSAYDALLNSTFEAVPQSTTTDTTAPTISGSYTLGKEGTMTITAYYTGGGPTFSVSGLTSGTGNVASTIPQPLGDSGLSIKFPSTTTLSGSVWTITIPNTKATNYTTNNNAYQQALSTQSQAVSSAQSLVAQRQAELAVKQASARTSDVDLAEADVLSAEGGLEAAQARYEDTIIRAPENGTVTRVDIKYGELADIQKTAITVQDIGNLYVEADINESNITRVALGQLVSISLDAFNASNQPIPLSGKVVQIDPSSVTTDGVVNYKIKVSIDTPMASIRPGMNAEITITEWSHKDSLAIPKTAITSVDGQNPYVYVITNLKRKKYKKQEIIVSGFIGDGNLAEVVSGINPSDTLALIAK